MSTARSQYAAAVLSSHSLTETVLVYTTTIVWLKCSFHSVIILFVIIPVEMVLSADGGAPSSTFAPFWVAKVLIIFELTKDMANFSVIIRRFFDKM